MLYSSFRKKAISGWLKKHQPTDFSSSLKLQKFLFFYEVLSKIEKDESEFQSLRGYKNGPVFSDVYGDYTYENGEFLKGIEQAYAKKPDQVNEERAKLAGFLVSILNEVELSNLTHKFNIWKAKENEIKRGIKNVPLHEEDLSKEDEDLMLSLRNTYPTDYIDSVKVIQISGKSFVIHKEDIPKLTDDTKSVFISLADEDDLQNPVYVSVAEDGVVLVD
ncbi:conserved hypothetical protein [[Clostridium] ultunense Esp]|nr:conserved hypothetical protein [[Clostridium] ultunense Esp]